MKTIVRKPYWNYEREETWLNEMAAQGKALTGYSWCRYVFEDAPKGEYIYRIELLDKHPRHPESKKYIRFVEETGAECVTTYMRWVYFRKRAADGPFDLYTDIGSRIKHYKRVSTLWHTFAAIELGTAGLNLALFAVDRTAMTRTNMILGCVLLSFGMLFLLIGAPIRQKLRRLKREKMLRES